MTLATERRHVSWNTPPGGWFLSRYPVRLGIRWLGRCIEIVRLTCTPVRRPLSFFIVSTQRNAGASVLRCLDSVFEQNYEGRLVRHLVIDDDSTDGTDKLISSWLTDHPGHRVTFVRHGHRRGGTVNTLDGLMAAPLGSIVIELNGDDWLPDPGVLSFLNRFYQDEDVWMTYNTFRQSDGIITIQLPPPRRVRRNRSYRRAYWSTSHLHTFRRELLDHLPAEVMRDPKTGDFWESADDLALYLSMLELAGEHARHVWRVTCVYNFHSKTEHNIDRSGQLERAARIRAATPLGALDRLARGTS